MRSNDLSFRDWMTILRRTNTFDWNLVGLTPEMSSLIDCLGWKFASMEEAARTFAQAARLIAGSQPAAGVDPGPLAYAPWVGAAAGAAVTCDRVRTISGEDPAFIQDECTQDALLRTIAHYAGRAKDGAMDVRLCIAAFAWWLIRAVVAALRQEVAGKDRVEAERILAPFAPMLVLLGRVMEEREEGRDKTAAAEEKLSAEMQEAAEERDALEAQLKMRGEPKVPRETLLELARRGGPTEAPPPAGRTGRARRTRR